MNIVEYLIYLVGCFSVGVFLTFAFSISGNRHDQVLAAIYDNGCSQHQIGVIEQKQRIDTYNLNSLENKTK